MAMSYAIVELAAISGTAARRVGGFRIRSEASTTDGTSALSRGTGYVFQGIKVQVGFPLPIVPKSNP
jgi:hypothetical protein